MKPTLLFSLLLLLVLTACDDDDDSLRITCAEGISLGQTLPLPQGESLQLVEIDDEFCPCDFVCIHAGSLSATLALTSDPATRITLTTAPAGPPLDARQDTIAGYVVRLDTIYTDIPCGGAVPESEICLGISVR